jgi:hypothetical protein
MCSFTAAKLSGRYRLQGSGATVPPSTSHQRIRVPVALHNWLGATVSTSQFSQTSKLRCAPIAAATS